MRHSTNEVLRTALIHYRLSMRKIMFIRVDMFVHRFRMRWMDYRYYRVGDICINVLLRW